MQEERRENLAGERAAAQDVTMGTTKAGLKSAVVTRSRMRDRAMACFLLGVLSIHESLDCAPSRGSNGDVPVETATSYEYGGAVLAPKLL